jgi:hypothetical protein
LLDNNSILPSGLSTNILDKRVKTYMNITIKYVKGSQATNARQHVIIKLLCSKQNHTPSELFYDAIIEHILLFIARGILIQFDSKYQRALSQRVTKVIL